MKNSAQLTFEYVKDYSTFNRKDTIVDLLCRNADSFNPRLAIGYEGNTLREAMEKYIHMDDSLFLIKVNEHIIGMSHLRLNGIVDGFEHVMDNLCVETTVLESIFRGKGIASILYEELESLNDTVIFSPYIFRSTPEDNQAQLHLYEKFGYTLLQTSTYRHKPDLKRCLFGKSFLLAKTV
jgi:ribosomal protein S18 acetylase RimI-like enzyme